METPRTFRIRRLNVKVGDGVGCRIIFMGGCVDVPRSAADDIERSGPSKEVAVVVIPYATSKRSAPSKRSALAYWGGTTGPIPDEVANEIEERLR